MHRWPLLLLAVLVAVVAACGSEASTDTLANASSSTVENSFPPASSNPASSPTTERPRFSDLPTITLGELPPEAFDTLELIRDGGPYPYDQDGSTFQNREGLLPDHEMGFYQEFTVDTPGLSHRGARRFVTGDDGAIYWTEDHYASFEELVPE